MATGAMRRNVEQTTTGPRYEAADVILLKPPNKIRGNRKVAPAVGIEPTT